jgi:hypothetical protein
LIAKGQGSQKRAAAAFKWEEEPLPEIKFEFELEASSETSGGVKSPPALHGIYAIMGEHSLCTALPDRPINFCITERHTRDVDLANYLAKTWLSPAIKQMRTSILSESRLRAPLSLHIPIPKPWLAQKAPPLPTYKAGVLKETHSRATYRFVGVEHKQIIPFTVDSQKYLFTTVESGKLGPRYAELSVVQTDIDESDLHTNSTRERKLQTAIRTGLKLVDLVDRAAKGKLSFREVRKHNIEPGELNAFVAEEIQEGSQTADDHVVDQRPLEEEEHQEEQRAAASG